MFEIYQKYLSLFCKAKKLKITVLDFFMQEKCYNKMTSVRKSYISKPFKKYRTENYYVLKNLEISWLLTKNLKGNYYITYIRRQIFLDMFLYFLYICI